MEQGCRFPWSSQLPLLPLPQQSSRQFHRSAKEAEEASPGLSLPVMRGEEMAHAYSIYGKKKANKDKGDMLSSGNLRQCLLYVATFFTTVLLQIRL